MKKNHVERNLLKVVMEIAIILVISMMMTGVICGILFSAIDYPSTTTTEYSATPTVEPTSTLSPTTPIVESTTEPTATPIVEPTNEPTAMPTPTSTPVPDKFELTQINVGPANAYLVRTNNITIFIDGGETKNYKVVKKYLAGIGIKNIDVLIVTHWHGDHADNMNSLCMDYNIPVVYGYSEAPKGEFKLTASASYQQMKDGDVFSWGSLTLTCVGPYEIGGSINKNSLNLLFQFGSRKVLICGDYCHSKTIEEYPELLQDIDVLQFPHHGLDTGGNGKGFCITRKTLTHMNPQYVLVPANTSGAARKLISSLGIEATIFNNQNGNITITSDGKNINVSTTIE